MPEQNSPTPWKKDKTWVRDATNQKIGAFEDDNDARLCIAAVNATSHVPIEVLENVEKDELRESHQRLLGVLKAIISSQGIVLPCDCPNDKPCSCGARAFWDETVQSIAQAERITDAETHPGT